MIDPSLNLTPMQRYELGRAYGEDLIYQAALGPDELVAQLRETLAFAAAVAGPPSRSLTRAP